MQDDYPTVSPGSARDIDHLEMPASLTQLILDHAAAAFPEEACGLVLGNRQNGGNGQNGYGRVTRTVRCRNLFSGTPAAETGFEIDPQDLFDVFRDVRQTAGEDVIGHYHSHPNGRCTPSPADLARVTDLQSVWMIVPMNGDGSTAGVRAWRPHANLTGFYEITLLSKLTEK